MQLMSSPDQITEQILRELTCNGRISNIELADRVGLSPSACLRRVQELERTSVITGYRAVLDPVARGAGFIAYITVGLSDHTKEAQESFARQNNLYADLATSWHYAVGRAASVRHLGRPMEPA